MRIWATECARLVEGAVHITASDIDPEAVTQCQATLLANGCPHAVVRAAPGLDALREEGVPNNWKYDVVIINCWADVICEVMMISDGPA